MILPPELEARVNRHAGRLGISNEEFMRLAIEMACDREEAPHVPEAVRMARPRLVGGTLDLPKGRVFGA